MRSAKKYFAFQVGDSRIKIWDSSFPSWIQSFLFFFQVLFLAL